MKKNYYENQILYQIKQNNYDFLSLYSDSTFITKKIIKSILKTLWFELDDNKIIFVIKKFISYSNSDIKFLLKIDSDTLESFLVNHTITENTFDILLQFFVIHTKKLKHKNIIGRNYHFFENNFYNYYIVKKIEDSYDFDVKINEDTLQEGMYELLIDLYDKISTQNPNLTMIDEYFATFKDQKMIDSLSRKRIENKAKYNEQSTNFAQNYKGLKNYLCFLNNKHGFCACCNSFVNTNYKTNIFESCAQKEYEKAIKGDKFDRVHFLMTHAKTLHTQTNVIALLNKYFKVNETKPLLESLRSIDLIENSDLEHYFCNFFRDLSLAELPNDKIDHHKRIIRIIISIKATITVKSCIICYLYTINNERLSKYVRLQIKAYMYQNCAYYKENMNFVISEIINSCLQDDSIHPSIFMPLATLFDQDLDNFIIENSFHIANNINLDVLNQNFVAYKNELLPFIIAHHMKINTDFDNLTLFDYKHEKVRSKYRCLLTVLLVLDDYDLNNLNDSFLQINFSDFLRVNLDHFLFLLKKVYLKKMFVYKKCIFEIFCIVFKQLERCETNWVNQLYPYFVFFYEKYIVNKKCSNKDHVNSSCYIDFITIFTKKVESIEKSSRFTKRYPLLDLEAKISDLEYEDLLDLAMSICKIKNTELLHIILNKLDEILLKLVHEASFVKEHSVENSALIMILNKLQNNYKNNVELYKFRGKHGIYDYNQIFRAADYVYINSFSLESASIYILENFLAEVDVKFQDLYFCAIQEILKNIENKNNIKKATWEASQQFSQTKFQLQSGIQDKPKKIYEAGYSYQTFLTNLLDNCLHLLQINDTIYYNLLRFGRYFDTKVKEIYTLIALKVLGTTNDFDFNSLLVLDHIKHVNHKILLFGLKSSLFSDFDCYTYRNTILVCMETKEYYYLIKKTEYETYSEDRDKLLQYLYYRVGNYDNCKAIGAKSSLMDVDSLFYDLCISKDYESAKNLVADNQNEEIMNCYLQDCIASFDTQYDFDFNKILTESDNAENYLSKWLDLSNEELKLNLFHFNYDIQLFKTHEHKEEALKQIEKRRQLFYNKTFMIQKHEELIIHLKKQEKTNLTAINYSKEEKLALKKFEINILLEKSKISRKEDNYAQSKIHINNLIKHKEVRAFYEKAKILAKNNQSHLAVDLLKKSLPYLDSKDQNYEKFYVLYAKLANNKISYQEACDKITASESLYYFKGKFYENTDRLEAFNAFLICFKNRKKYKHILVAKIIFFLTENPSEQNPGQLNTYYKNACSLFCKILDQNDFCEFITNFNDIVPKIIHKNVNVAETIVLLLNELYKHYPQKAFWLSLITYNSKQKEAQSALKKIIINLSLELKVIFQNIFALSQNFLKICDYKIKANETQLSVQKHFKIQLTYTEDVCIPNSKFSIRLAGFLDQIQVYRSLQSPKKLTLAGSNGKLYCILCKPNDDLRKDNRFMDLNRTLNNIFKKDKETAQKDLYIRTYTVIPINHKNGIIEWVDGLQSLKSICESEYNNIDKSIHDVQGNYKASKKIGPKKFAEVCDFYPPVLYKFFDANKDPYQHYITRQRFIKTFAVMNTVGWFMGLGDRHLENIMIDATTGDTFHVDLNSIFENAKLLSVPERVPFRLTQNIVHAFGPLGIEGTYKNTMVNCLNAMMRNKDLILSNLLLFIYDPLHEWSNSKKKIEDVINNVIRKQIEKLSSEDAKTCIDDLIRKATDHDNLANMYIGWCSYI